MKSLSTAKPGSTLSKYILTYRSLILFLLIAVTISTNAQDRWRGSIRGAVNFPVKDLSIAELNTGFGLEGNVSYRLMQHLSIYTGWGYSNFSSSSPNKGYSYEETGYQFGLQFIHPITTRLNYMIGGGGLYNHIEVENKNGEIIDDSGHGLGWQLEGGLSIPLGKRWQLLPSIRYRSLSRPLKSEGGSTDVDLKYISAGAGISFQF